MCGLREGLSVPVPRAVRDKRLFLQSGTASHFWTLSQFGLQATGRASLGKVLSLPSLPPNQIIPTEAELGLVVFWKSCSRCPAFTDILPFYACFLRAAVIVSTLVCLQALSNMLSTI